jgi:hypothetical protein
MRKVLSYIVAAFILAWSIFYLCGIVAHAQTSRPPDRLTNGKGSIQLNGDGSAGIYPALGTGVEMVSTCQGAPVSLPSRVRWCYDAATATMRISANGGIYLNWTNPGSAPGTVSSVALGAPASLFSITGPNPVTTSGQFTLNLISQAANTVFAAPNAGGVPGFTLLTSAHIPSLDTSKLTTGVVLPARGGLGLAPPFALGDIFYADTTTSLARLAGNLTTNNQFLRSSGNGTNVTTFGYSVLGSADIPAINLANTGNGGITGQLPYNSGGSGVNVLGSANQLFGVNAAGTGREFKTPIAGNNLSITHTAGGIRWDVNSIVSTTTQAPDGSAAAPSFSYSNETNSGDYRSGAGDVRKSILGVDAYRWTSTLNQSFKPTQFSSVGVNTSPISSGFDFYQLGGGHRIAALATPAQPTVTPNTTGAATYTYSIVAKDAQGNRTLQSVVRTITNGAATANNTITWTAVPGAASYDVLRGTQSIALGVTTTTFTDSNAASSAYTTPTRNTTADATIDGNETVSGTMTANAFSGNGASVTNVNAASVGGQSLSNLDTRYRAASALNPTVVYYNKTGTTNLADTTMQSLGGVGDQAMRATFIGEATGNGGDTITVTLTYTSGLSCSNRTHVVTFTTGSGSRLNDSFPFLTGGCGGSAVSYAISGATGNGGFAVAAALERIYP